MKSTFIATLASIALAATACCGIPKEGDAVSLDSLQKAEWVQGGAALATILAAQTLCSPPASAALIAASALKSAPAVAGSVTFIHSLYLMTTQTILKTTAVVLVIAAAPVALLWNQNHELKQQIAQLKSHPSIALAEDPRNVAVAMIDESSPSRPGKTNRPAPAVAKEKPAGPMDAFANMLKGDNLSVIIAGEAKKESARQFARLTARLNLTEDQQQALKAFFDKKDQITGEMMKEVTASGAMERSMTGDDNLTEGDKALMAKLSEEKSKSQSLDAFLDTILTPEQAAEQTKAREEQRTEAAKSAAQSSLEDVTKRIDLSDDQKDRLYQAVAQQRLTPKAGTSPAKTTLDIGNLLSGGSDDDSSGSNEDDDEVLSQVLTPEQLEMLKKSRADEAAQDAELMKTLMPQLGTRTDIKIKTGK